MVDYKIQHETNTTKLKLQLRKILLLSSFNREELIQGRNEVEMTTGFLLILTEVLCVL
jgi:hypothetical protein